MKTAPYLKLDRIKHNLQVEKLLPPEIARQCHALPISIDGQQVTVAISSPEDTAASTMVSSVLGRPVCFVRADLNAIDHRLAEVWPGNPDAVSRLLVWSTGDPADQALSEYAENLAGLLHAALYRFSPPSQPKETLKELNFALAEFKPDLVLAGFPGGSMPKRGSKPGLLNEYLHHQSVSTLIAASPRWPIEKVLLVLVDCSPDSDMAVEWAGKIARPKHAAVSILPLLPPVPLLYGASLQYSIPSLLKANDPLGQKARRISEHFSDTGIQATFRLRQGEPADQLRAEITASSPDLVILAAEDRRLLRRLLAGGLLKPIWDAADCPVLISKNA